MALYNFGMLFFNGPPVQGTDAVQSVAITGTPTGGTFALVWNAEQTAALPYNATAAQVQAALVALAGVEPGDFLCSGGPLPGTPIALHLAGNLAGLPHALLTVAASALIGGSAPAVSVSSTVTGVRGTMRGAQNGCFLAATDGAGNGLLYANTGTRGTPLWVEVDALP